MALLLLAELVCWWKKNDYRVVKRKVKRCCCVMALLLLAELVCWWKKNDYRVVKRKVKRCCQVAIQSVVWFVEDAEANLILGNAANLQPGISRRIQDWQYRENKDSRNTARPLLVYSTSFIYGCISFVSGRYFPNSYVRQVQCVQWFYVILTYLGPGLT